MIADTTSSRLTCKMTYPILPYETVSQLKVQETGLGSCLQ